MSLVHIGEVIKELPVIRDNNIFMMFCSGNCNDATMFEELCPCCLQEYYDYKTENR